jgi:hypothetical protein
VNDQGQWGCALCTSVLTIFPATMFTLIAIGLFRLVRSLFQIWDDEEEE